MDRVATFNEPVIVIGDLNIRLDRVDDSNKRQFVELHETYGFANHAASLMSLFLDKICRIWSSALDRSSAYLLESHLSILDRIS